jgi:hypothetical protein
MTSGLERIVEYYFDHRSTLASQLVAWPLSTVAAAYSTTFTDSPAAAVALSSVVAQATYWPTFIAGKVIGDRKQFATAGKINWTVVRQKVAEYASWWGAGELVYSGIRSAIMGGLRAAGVDNAQSSAYTDIATGSAYTAVLPFMESAITRFNQSVENRVVTPALGLIKGLRDYLTHGNPMY